jgi:hypothetical protein
VERFAVFEALSNLVRQTPLLTRVLDTTLGFLASLYRNWIEQTSRPLTLTYVLQCLRQGRDMTLAFFHVWREAAVAHPGSVVDTLFAVAAARWSMLLRELLLSGSLFMHEAKDLLEILSPLE